MISWWWLIAVALWPLYVVIGYGIWMTVEEDVLSWRIK